MKGISEPNIWYFHQPFDHRVIFEDYFSDFQAIVRINESLRPSLNNSFFDRVLECVHVYDVY